MSTDTADIPQTPGLEIHVIVAAYNEAPRIQATLAALAAAFPAHRCGWPTTVPPTPRPSLLSEPARGCCAASADGKGAAATLAARDALQANDDSEPIFILCDGDLAESASGLGELVDALRRGDVDFWVAAFATRVGGGVGSAVAFARWAIRRRCGRENEAPISGQRALRASVLDDVLPFARGFGMEIGMTIDAVRAGHRVVEVELDLSHRATGRTLSGFAHRGRQLVDFVRVYFARR